MGQGWNQGRYLGGSWNNPSKTLWRQKRVRDVVRFQIYFERNDDRIC